MATTDQTRPTTTSSDGLLVLTLNSKTIEVQIPRQLSLRVARMHAIEQIAAVLKGPAITEALKSLGFK